MENSEDKRVGTRVFKKSSPNGKITTYLGKRDFIDHGGFVDSIDGMVLIDEEYIRSNRKVTAFLLSAFRYGREDLDVLGLTFRKDLITESFQVYPVDETSARPYTHLQERLRKKLGVNAFPFWFDIPTHSASSVTLQPSPEDTGKPCGVDYELKTVVGDVNGYNSEKHKQPSCVRLAIRKLTYCPFKTRPQPTVEATKEFMMSPGSLHLEASLDREMYYHGEFIAVNVHIQNNSNRTVKKIKVSVAQVADICIFTSASYSCDVAKVESVEGFPVGPGATLSKVYSLCPLLSNNKDKRGLALDGQLKHEDTNLASSTPIIDDGASKENLGIIVQYKVKVRLYISGALGRELAAELPFTLTHPKPPELVSNEKKTSASSINDNIGGLDIDLIQLETCDAPSRDDIIFEDFARLRLHACDVEGVVEPT